MQQCKECLYGTNTSSMRWQIQILFWPTTVTIFSPIFLFFFAQTKNEPPAFTWQITSIKAKFNTTFAVPPVWTTNYHQGTMKQQGEQYSSPTGDTINNSTGKHKCQVSPVKSEMMSFYFHVAHTIQIPLKSYHSSTIPSFSYSLKSKHVCACVCIWICKSSM